MLYGFLRFLLRKTGDPDSSSGLCALLAAMVFAVHPIHTEVVNSVFNRSDMMVALFTLGGLWWLLHFLDRHPGRAWFGLAITYFLGMLSKESAAVIPGLAVVLIVLVTPGDLTARLRKCLPVLWLLLPLGVYLVMRANALFPPGMANAVQATEGAGLPAMLEQVALPDSTGLLKIVGIFGQALTKIAWPYPLQLSYPRPSTPLLVVYAAINLLLIIAAFVQLSRKRYGLATGLAFFYLAMLPAVRFIGIGWADASFAERYAYVPSIGLTILLAFALRAVAQRFTPRVLVRIAVPLLLILTALTWDRNADWRSEVSLFGPEYQRGDRGEETLRWMASAHLYARNYIRVVKICDDNQALQEKFGDSTFVQSCASAYERLQRYAEVERAHLYAIEHDKTRIAASMSLARFYLRHARVQDAKKRFITAIDWSDDPAEKALNTAEMIIGLNPNSREQAIIAKGYIEQALHLRPGWPKAEQMLQAVQQALNASRTPQQGGKNLP
jgi:tetratricopeptide (TPR) repeat protein